jgi:poly(beta-D-mannuronate) lyase
MDDAACALLWMSAWANQGALVSLPPGEGQFNRDQAFAGLGLAYLQIAAVEVEGFNPGPAIVAWLREAAQQARVHYETQAGSVSRMNNHRYYAAVAVAVAAIAAGDEGLFGWSMETLRKASCSAGVDGSLPLEMRRGSRAREYQMFATGPLIMLAELGASNGIETYEQCDRAVPRIVGFTLRSIDDPRAVEKHAEKRQQAIGELKGYRVAWLAPWLKRNPDRAWAQRVGNIGKLRLTSLGGDLSLLFNN